MLEGGWVTEFPDTEARQIQLCKENRIVAGMADAVVVVESGERRLNHNRRDCKLLFSRGFAVPEEQPMPDQQGATP